MSLAYRTPVRSGGSWPGCQSRVLDRHARGGESHLDFTGHHLERFAGFDVLLGVEVLDGGSDPQGQVERGDGGQHVHAASLLAEGCPESLGTDPEGTHDTDSRDHNARSGIHGLVKHWGRIDYLGTRHDGGTPQPASRQR